MGHWSWLFSAAKTKKKKYRLWKQEPSEFLWHRAASGLLSQISVRVLSFLAPFTPHSGKHVLPPPPPPPQPLPHALHSLFSISPLWPLLLTSVQWGTNDFGAIKSNLIFLFSHNMRLFSAHLICVKGVHAGELTFIQNNWKPTITMQLWFKIYLEILLKNKTKQPTYGHYFLLSGQLIGVRDN